jgi:hypothetical protein
MCKENWLPSKNDSGGLVQLRKGYRLHDTDEYSSKMVDEASSQALGLDAEAIKAKYNQLQKQYEKDAKKLTENANSLTMMYSSECPQCKGKSNKTIISVGLTEEKFYIPRIMFSDDKTGINNDIKIAQTERTKILKQITEKRKELHKLIEKAEKESEFNNQKMNESSSQISSNEGKIESSTSTPKKLKLESKVRDLQKAFHEIFPKKGISCHDALKMRKSAKYKKAKADWLNAIDAEEKQKNIEKVKIIKITNVVSKKNQKNNESDPYEKEIDILKTQIAELRGGIGGSSGLEYWEKAITELEHKKTSYICKNCKTGLEKDCDFCKIEYNKLQNKKIENTRILYPLLPRDIPVCNSCVRQWGKEAF